MKSIYLVAVTLCLAAVNNFSQAADFANAGDYCPLVASSATTREIRSAPLNHVDLRPTSSTEAAAGDTVLYDFRADWCGPCRSMDPVVGQLLGEGYPIKRINVDQDRELANRFGVQGIPCFVMVVNGKEVDRVVGATDFGRLEAMFRRNGVSPASVTMRGQSPDYHEPRRTPSPQDIAPNKAIPFPVSDGGGNGIETAQETQSSPGAATAGLDDRLIRASVRLRIQDETGNSVGSGTIIDARAGEALIITCGHMFRDAVKNGRISVDLFGPGAPQGVSGTLIDFDLKSEVGLISIRTNYPIVAAHLAPPGYVVHPNDRVVSIGCDGGADATARETHVTSINRYVGSPNLQVAFQPVQGRSGGGLFTPEGFVIGVCYAADPEDHQGLFSALPALCEELDRSKLGFVCRADTDGRRYAAGVQNEMGNGECGMRNGSESLSRRPQAAESFSRDAQRSVDAQQGFAVQDSEVGSRKSEIGNSFSRNPPANMPAGLSSEEQATLAALREKTEDSEVICIVRPAGNSQAHSEIVVLDHVSPGFIERLAAERPTNSGRQLTSLEVPRGSASTQAAMNATMKQGSNNLPRTAPAPTNTNTVQDAGAARPAKQINLDPWWVDLLEPAK